MEKALQVNSLGVHNWLARRYHVLHDLADSVIDSVLSSAS